MATLFASVLAALAQNNLSVPRFLNESASSGINSRYEGDWEYMVGGGTAVFDCDGDQYPEIFLAGGTSRAVLYRNLSRRGKALHFSRIQSGLELRDVTGAYPLDVDADGITDLAVLRVGGNVLFRGLGGCKFENANQRWNFAAGDAWHTAFSAMWERGQTLPTLAVGAYIDRAQSDYPWGSCTDNWLLRPASSQAYAAPLALKPSYCSLSMLFSDWNRSGMPALRISNDREYYKGGQEQLWRMDASPRLYSEDDGWKRLQIWGMGIASHDLTGDGYPEYYLTSMADQKLQALEVDATRPQYADIAFKRGVTAHRPYTGDNTRPSTGWHAQFADANNDGLFDLFVAKGNVALMPDFAMSDPNNLLLQQQSGDFLEVGEQAGVASGKRGRGAMLADLNLDGWLDLVVVNRWDNAEVWRNTPQQGNWLQIRLRQEGGNRDAIGSWLELTLENGKVVRQELTVGGGHASGHLGFVHFGLGNSKTASVRVQYPDGVWSEPQVLDGNQFYLWQREQRAQVWIPKR
ncbi:MAG: CRTAC1 family protein [Deinococcales bacterium]